MAVARDQKLVQASLSTYLHMNQGKLKKQKASSFIQADRQVMTSNAKAEKKRRNRYWSLIVTKADKGRQHVVYN